MRSAVIWKRCRPSNAVPASAATSIARTFFPLRDRSRSPCPRREPDLLAVVRDARAPGRPPGRGRTRGRSRRSRVRAHHPSRSAGGRGATRSSRIPAGAATSSGGRARDRTAAPFPPRRGNRAPAARSAGSSPSASARADVDHDSPSASSATPLRLAVHRPGASTTTGAARGAAGARTPARSHARRRAVAAPRGAAPPRPEAARDGCVGDPRAERPRHERVPRRSPGHASPSARAIANRTGRRASDACGWRPAPRRRQAPRRRPGPAGPHQPRQRTRPRTSALPRGAAPST